ncbi:hypothetical protein [Streptomyces sp. SA15]|uniref:hypothetical protein n=1 Tax=Streptomyces sp. SA15 TaxID=934019 RepID=UPI00117F2F05|nr:hypothetical protein [Streptomyces sp. SA15]
MKRKAKERLTTKVDAAKSTLERNQAVGQPSWNQTQEAAQRAWISTKARTLSISPFLPSVLYCTISAFLIFLPRSTLRQFAVAVIAAYTQMILVVLLDQIDNIAAKRSFAVDFLYASTIEVLAAARTHSVAHTPDSTAKLIATVEDLGDCMHRYARHAFPAARSTVRSRLITQAAASRETLYARLNLVLTSREKIPELTSFVATVINSIQQQEPLSLPHDELFTDPVTEPSESIWRLILGHLISLICGVGILLGIQISGIGSEYAVILAPILLALVAAPKIWLHKGGPATRRADQEVESHSTAESITSE